MQPLSPWDSTSIIPLLEETKNGRHIDKVSQQPTWYHSGVHSRWMTHEKLCYPEGEEKFTQLSSKTHKKI